MDYFPERRVRVSHGRGLRSDAMILSHEAQRLLSCSAGVAACVRASVQFEREAQGAGGGRVAESERGSGGARLG
jgi:hypothetical protein